jgi:hypothetical protein
LKFENFEIVKKPTKKDETRQGKPKNHTKTKNPVQNHRGKKDNQARPIPKCAVAGGV